MGTKNNPGEYDCYAAAEPNEPMFVLLGRDKHAPTLVWLWATLRELDGEDPMKVEEARDCCASMLEYAKQNGRPVVGIGQAGIAAVAELIRAANYSVRAAPPDEDFKKLMRLFLCHTEFEQPEAEGEDAYSEENQERAYEESKQILDEAVDTNSR